jgi:acetylornithine/N-succinyldiaminopimelate aminotransferase
MDANLIRDLEAKYVLQTYGRSPMVFDRGEGVRLYDTDGKAYLDFVSGIAVNALGYGDPDVIRAITAQAGRLIHVSNLYYTAPQAQLAQLLVELSFADKVFFCNSGAEANEAAIKFARKWAGKTHGPGKTDFIAFEGAFHGRTMGALAMTPRAHYQDAFRPLMPGVKLARFNDLDSVAGQIDDRTCAIFIEPLQGEGGIYPADPAFLQGLRGLCDAHGILLVFDEVQCGLGRTGTLWAHQLYGVTPDMMTLAKPLAGGLPIGATLLTQAIADTIEPGDHASTFAGGPVVCAAALATVRKISEPAFLEHVRWAGSYLSEDLDELTHKYTCIEGIRGAGLIWGIQTNLADVGGLVQAGYDRGLLTCKAGAQVLRLIPPLTVTKDDLDEAVAILDHLFAQASGLEAAPAPGAQGAPEITVRQPLIRDVPQMANIINSWANQGQMLARSQHHLFQFLRDFCVATVDGKVVGCAALSLAWEDLAEIRSLAVAREWQGQGIGRCLIESLLVEARQLGLPQAFVLTYQKEFFEHMGFHVVPNDSLPHKVWGDCLNCPKFPSCDETAMVIDLDKQEE